jgi:glycerol-3-phosphate O-acyltransferase
MGLIGTAVEAQRSLCQAGRNEKVFIVPLVMSYHFVLEGKYLIEQHLASTGKEKYLRSRDDFYSFRKLFRFAWQFFTAKSEINLSFGKPFDVLGNFVDKEGVSYDRHQRPVQIAEYFISNGQVVEDLQRETEYTQMLADKIAQRYQVENMVLSSHIVAFVGFNLLREMNPRFDIYGLMRLPEEDFHFEYANFVAATAALQEKLFEMERTGAVKLADEVHLPTKQLVKLGIELLGVYHTEKPLKSNKGSNRIESEDFKLLYFYHNRLENYCLDKAVKWEKFVTQIRMNEEVV